MAILFTHRQRVWWILLLIRMAVFALRIISCRLPVVLSGCEPDGTLSQIGNIARLGHGWGVSKRYMTEFSQPLPSWRLAACLYTCSLFVSIHSSARGRCRYLHEYCQLRIYAFRYNIVSIVRTNKEEEYRPWHHKSYAQRAPTGSRTYNNSRYRKAPLLIV